MLINLFCITEYPLDYRSLIFQIRNRINEILQPKIIDTKSINSTFLYVLCMSFSYLCENEKVNSTLENLLKLNLEIRSRHQNPLWTLTSNKQLLLMSQMSGAIISSKVLHLLILRIRHLPLGRRACASVLFYFKNAYVTYPKVAKLSAF